MAEPHADALADTLQRALAAADVPEADAFASRVARGLARFSLNTLNQHGQMTDVTVTVRAIARASDGARIASVTTSDSSVESVTRALHRARANAERSPVVPGWPVLAGADDAAPKAAVPSVPRFSASTARATADERTDRVTSALDIARANGLTAAGLLDTSTTAMAVANTRGLVRASDLTFATFKMFALDSSGVSGFAQATHRDLSQIDVATCARRAAEKSIAGKDAIALPAGEYDVVLEPQAVTELLEWLCFIAFGAREVQDGTSPLAGRIGERITGERVTIVDDANDPGELGFGPTFDREGTARKRVVLVDRGIAGAPVFDRLYAARMGSESTGHAAPPNGFDDAPVAQSLAMAGGADSIDDLVGRIERGLYITRFHYVNGFLDPRRAVMTGLTRDGTFLIENGRLGRGVKNMRFTDSVLDAFTRIDGVTEARAAVPTWWSNAGAFVAPSLLVRRLRFSSGG